MNVALWVMQGVVAAILFVAGLTKVSRPKEKLVDQMKWVENSPGAFVKFLGAAELLGGIGLILPAALGIAPVLTPLAAVGAVLVFAGAVVIHVRAKEFPGAAFTAVMLVLSAVIVWGRFGPYSF